MKNICIKIVAFTATTIMCSNTITAQQLTTVSFSQTPDAIHYPTEIKYQPCKSLFKPQSSDTLGWMVKIKHLSPKNFSFNKDSLNILKANVINEYDDNTNNSVWQYKTLADAPLTGINFEGNSFNSFSPLDNSVAISNNGIIVSITNSMIKYYDTNGSLLFNSSLDDFFDASLPDLYDPRVIYDSEADRFIFVVLNWGYSLSDSKVLLNFSKTNNPSDGWWGYELNGPFANSTWIDFPSIGISDKDFFVTGNLFTSNNSPKGAVIFQINKQKCYSGNTMKYKVWNNTQDKQGGLTFTIMPVSYGHQGNYGQGIYLVSSGAIEGNNINLFKITDEVLGNPQLEVYSIAVTYYSAAADAKQKGTSKLLSLPSTQMLSGFYLNNKVHCVFHADYSSGYAGIFYYKIDVTAKTATTAKYGKSGFNYAYPSVASFSNSASDEKVIIGFLNSNSTTYPEIRAVVCDASMNWSNDILLKQGEDYVDILQGNAEQWGDYTTLTKKHNESYPSVWLSACYGAKVHTYKTWITELYPAGSIPSNIKPVQGAKETTSLKIYPNPVYENFFMEFEINETQHITISITNMNGQLVKELYNGMLKEGKNLLGFNKHALLQGIYLINIESAEQIIKQKKIIIND